MLLTIQAVVWASDVVTCQGTLVKFLWLDRLT